MSAGLIDVHAHWLPAELFGLPSGSPYGAMRDQDGELFLGDLPLSIRTEAMSDVNAIISDMDAHEISLRALSPPPFAFAVNSSSEDYIDEYNASLSKVVTESTGRLAGLGLTRLDDASAAARQVADIAKAGVLAGVAIPPMLRGASLDVGVLRAVLRSAAQHRLAVLVHPMQLPRPEWSSYYLANLIGNPVETATAVASGILGGVLGELPDLRICFVHGGGCAPAILGRWSHAWQARADVRAGSSIDPRDLFRSAYFDTVTHDLAALELLASHAGEDRILCGTDYPFDMAEPNLPAFVDSTGLDRVALQRSGKAFLGVRVPQTELQ
ncbi:amidohydrolase family protein [Arthrobacter bambusae]|uniref:Aminocarboxymuconate-semialdehyde decarboxylase n=1 Tax=Arthrobacter bambusae TaxID=1338426 RepID=A0AAW8DJ62_9MICC|nr:amidohydrolase family protein [Arthrobacter bambusae]MDP9905665.1 aminocarboxymuconate-semialdehyde decarboxylase [Arthrobacter bambusae]MDQ0127253.1 aminocarboxymuconate-semialdehyde decarboxylase [Arthrobacter bambusae]MDQ0178595.1 aminocarboxymuconate-semialdehyde decarboxylase [Arthrobacter bambusae]